MRIRIDSNWRTARRVLVTIAVVALGLLGGVLPASATSGGTIYTGGSIPVNVRSGPGTGFGVVGSLAVGTAVSVACVADGTGVTGPFGFTTLWDNLGGNRWVTDAYVNTGVNDAIAMDCGRTTGGGYRSGTFVGAWNVWAGCGFTSTGFMAITASRLNGPDWHPGDEGGCDHKGYWTYGNGPTPSLPDYAEWWAYPGAGATCDITVSWPFMGNPTTRAHYHIYTNRSQTWLGERFVSQRANSADLGSWTADGTGQLRVLLVDSSVQGGGTEEVGAGQVSFNCTSRF